MKELSKEETDRLFAVITSNGCREMEETRFHQAVNEAIHNLESQVSQDFCEWLEIKKAEGIIYETDCENRFICGDYEKLEKDLKYCPYCGSPIKIKRGK